MFDDHSFLLTGVFGRLILAAIALVFLWYAVFWALQ